MTVQLKIKVVPGSSREQLHWLGTLLKINVRAAPEKGQANAAVEKLLANTLTVPASAVRIVSGFGSPLKTVEIDGIDQIALHEKLKSAVK